MSKLNFVKRCYNCGEILQTKDKDKPGYISQEFLDTPWPAVLFCDKCYDGQKFNFSPCLPTVSRDFISMLEDAEASDATIIFAVDLFSFESSFVPEIVQTIEGLNIIVVANKRDLLPKKYPDEELREYVAHRFRAAHLRVVKEDVFLTSLTSATDVTKFAETIKERRKRHDVYIIGASGAGKTLLVSSFLRSYQNLSNQVISTSFYPGTDIQVMQIPLDANSSLYDTPGTSIENSILSKVESSVASIIKPNEAVKNRKITLKEGESFFVGGLAVVSLLSGDKTSISCYFSNKVVLTKIGDEEALPRFQSFINKNGISPISKIVKTPNDLDAFDVYVEETGQRDIGIQGLGWFSFIGNKQTFRIMIPKGVSIYTTRAKIKEKGE